MDASWDTDEGSNGQPHGGSNYPGDTKVEFELFEPNRDKRNDGYELPHVVSLAAGHGPGNR